MTAVGLGEKKLGSYQLDFMHTCPWCNRKGTIEMEVNQDYLALLFIPFLPAGKSGRIRCTDCNYEKEQIFFTSEELTEFKKNRKKTRLQLWTVAGFFGIVLLVALLAFFGRVGHHSTGFTAKEKQICFPEKGDLYQVRWEDRDYSWFKIDSVNQDSVFGVYNLSSTPIPAGLSAIRYAEYDTNLVSYSRHELKVMYVEHQIQDVIRAKK